MALIQFLSLLSLFSVSAACLSNQPAHASCPACLFIQSLSCLCSMSLESSARIFCPACLFIQSLSCLCSLPLEAACSYLLPRMSLYSVSFLPLQPASRSSLLVPPASCVFFVSRLSPNKACVDILSCPLSLPSPQQARVSCLYHLSLNHRLSLLSTEYL
jgi:hypothetical protein